MNRLLLLLLLLPCLATAQKWDPESADPPSTSGNWEPPRRRRMDMVPYRLLVFEECKPDRSGMLRQTDELRIGIISANPFARLIPTEVDSSLTLTIRTLYRGEYPEPFCIPEHSFDLRIVVASDTSVFRVERSESGVSTVCRKSCPRVLLEPIHRLDADIVSMQFPRGATRSDVRDFVAALKEKFGSQGDVVEVVQLAAGYYPCMAISEVETVVLSSRRRTLAINRTPLGYLVCVRVMDSSKHETVLQWVSQRSPEAGIRLARETR